MQMTLCVKSGDVIFKQGDPQRSMYIIQEGKVAIIIDYGKDSEKQLVELEAGQFFGEMSLLEEAPRSATAIAITDGTLDVIDQEGFQTYIQTNPEFAMSLLVYFSSRLRAVTGDYQETCRAMAKVYALDGVKKAVEQEENDDKNTEKGFLSNRIEKCIEDFNNPTYGAVSSNQRYFNLLYGPSGFLV